MHASIWVVVQALIGNGWEWVRLVVVGLFSATTVYCLARRIYGIEMLSINLLFGSTVLGMQNGAMNRYNIALICVILMAGMAKISCVRSSPPTHGWAGLLQCGDVRLLAFTYIGLSAVRFFIAFSPLKKLFSESGWNGIMLLVFTIVFFIWQACVIYRNVQQRQGFQ
jgi:hypothetical protein